MFKKCFSSFVPVSVYCGADFGKMDSCPIDQSPCEDFNIDPATGRPMSDITKLVRAQSQYEKEQLLKHIVERPMSEVLTAEQIKQELKFGKPRLAQLPSELADFAEYAQQKLFDEKSDLRQKRLDAVKRKYEDAAINDLFGEKPKDKPNEDEKPKN